MFVRVETFFLALTCMPVFVCPKNSWFVSCRQDTFQNSLANNSNDVILDMFLSAGATGPFHIDNFVYRKNPNIDALLQKAQHKRVSPLQSVFVLQKSFFILNSEYVPYIYYYIQYAFTFYLFCSCVVCAVVCYHSFYK